MGDTNLKRAVAIKVLLASVAEDAERPRAGPHHTARVTIRLRVA